MAEVVGACTQPACEIGKYLCAAIARRINYAKKLSKNWKALCEKASELGRKRDYIVAEIERLNVHKSPTEECKAWREEVVEMEKKVENIKQEFDVEKKCVGGLCPDIFARMELGEQVVSMIGHINELLVKSKFEQGYLVDSPPAAVEKKPEHYSTLATSAYHTRDVVLGKIRDKKTPKIGIWGMGGVGKTTVLKLLNNTPNIAKIFDFVIWVTVSKSQSVRMIQEEVGQRLSVVMTKDETDDRVANKLFKSLEGKRYLLLLDDVWEMVDLDAVGLPNATQENGCKVVLTTRKLDVCHKMRTDTEIKVKVLPEKEAREMFYANAGDVARLPDISKLAESIVTECDGLPLALMVVSGALRKESNVNIWRDFLRQLKSPATSSIEDMNENVFKILKVSYDRLKDTTKKQCLLFCGMYPEDSNIKKSELIGYWRAEGILSSKLTLAEAHDNGDAILQALVDSSLLEKCDDDHVKMHDIVRDLVLAMTSPKGEEPQHLVRAGISSEKNPDPEEWKKATRISFINHDLRNLPESPYCPELLTLLLQENDTLEVIPEAFFSNMPNLRVLDISRTRIKSLPTSICKLESLRELVLLDCYYLESLPKEVFALKGLEVLSIKTTEGLIPTMNFGAPVSSANIYYKWRSSWVGLSDESIDTISKELSNLSSLSSLMFDFRRVCNLQHFVENSRSWKEGRLEQFWFFFGNIRYAGRGGEKRGSGLLSGIEDGSSYNWLELKGHDKIITLLEMGTHNRYELRYCLIEGCVLEIVNGNRVERDAFRNLDDLILVSFTNLKSLELYDCPSIDQLFSSGFAVQQLSNLETLLVHRCREMKRLISDDHKVEYEALPKLRSLSFDFLPKFISFLNSVPMCWQSLEHVRIVHCPKLRKLPFDTNSAPNLKEIEGHRNWRDALEWDNDAIKSKLLPLFKVVK